MIRMTNKSAGWTDVFRKPKPCRAHFAFMGAAPMRARKHGKRFGWRTSPGFNQFHPVSTIVCEKYIPSAKTPGKILPRINHVPCLRDRFGNTPKHPTRRPLLSTRRGAGARSEKTSLIDNRSLKAMMRADSTLRQRRPISLNGRNLWCALTGASALLIRQWLADCYAVRPIK